MSLTWVTGGSGGGGGRPASSGGEVLKTGYIKKTKTMKKKFFVLRAECGDHPSCLEYYDSEKKWKAHQPPKRVITLQSCFNINRRNDLKQRYVVALYTKDDCFCLALDSEEEAQQWLDALLETQRGEDVAEGERPKPAFEHVWQVQVQKKGLGSSRNILGSYMLCLTSHSLTLVRNGSVSTQQQATSAAATCTPSASEILSDSVEFSLNTIRRCGHSDCFFYMEVGRSSVTGAGELWMQTEDPNIAQNMHDSIFHAMMSCRNSSSAQKGERGASDADLAPHPRTRSSSANEATKPVSVLQRGSSARYVAQSSNQSQLNFNVPSPGSVSAPQSAGWRPIALPHHPSAQPQQLPSGHPQRLGWGGIVGGTPRHVLQQQHHHHHQGNNSAALAAAAAANSPSQRRHSVSGMGSRERCDSLPSSRARTISEGPPSSSLPSSHRPSPPSAAHSPSSNATHHAPHHPLHHVHPLHHHPLHHVHPPSSSSSVVVRGGHLVPGMGGHARPHSMYSRTAGLSYSPPIVSSPVSPASGACSTTDSAGSSLSMEEGEGWCGSNGGVTDGGEGGAYAPYGSRFGHSLTPDEPAIVEENADEEYMTWVPGGTGLDMDEEEGEGGGGDAEDEDEEEEEGGERGGGDEVDGALRRPKRWRSKKSVHRAPTLRQSALPGDYVPMAAPDASARPPLVTAFPSPLHATPASASSPPPNFQPIYAATHGSLSLPLQPVSLGARPCQATSRASSSSSKGGPQLGKACTSSPPPPQQQQQEDSSPYMEMHSPCGTSPPIHSSTDGYMPMSPVGGGGGGPLVADAVRGKQQDGYVPMTPGHPSDDGYVDMEPHQHKAHDGDGAYVVGTRGDMSPAASSCSVTSGTPSTDTRFSEYHLEKVSSYFTPSEEEEEEVGVGDDILPMERPVRAYSVGSKPETFRRKNCLPVPNNGTDIHKSPTSSSTLEVGVVEAVRVRAFSVGSRQCQGPSSSGGGSSSSPLHHSPHRHPAPHAKAQGTAHASPRGNALSPKGVAAAAAAPASSSAAAKRGSKSSSAPVLHALSNSWSGSSTLCSPPGSLLSPHPSQPSSRAVVVSGAGDPDNDLMELDFSGGASRGGQGKGGAEESPYVPMGVPPPGSTVVPGPRVLESSTPSSSSFSPPLLMSPLGPGAKAPSNASSASSSVTLEEEYVDMQCRAKKGGGGGSGGGDSYMEMFPVGRKSSLAAPEGHPGDYVNMEGRGGGKGEASRPIAIRKGREEGDKEQGGPRGGSSPNFSLAGLLSRKSSSGTPPKGPFSAVDSGSPFASLRRSRKKRVQEDEEEVGSEGGGASQGAPPGELATPTAIFPFSLNSPGSPVRPFPGHHYDSASKCPVDATSGSVHISYPPPSSFAPTTTTTASGTASTSHPPSRPKAADGRRRSEYSLPPAGGERGQEGKPFAPDYTNCGPAPRSESNYMPMAPCPGRVRKESVMSAPPNLTPATTSPSSSLFSSFSPSSKFSTQSSSDYVCMKAVRSPDSATRTCTPQRTKSSSADYMDIKLSSEPPTPASLTTAPGASGGSSKSDDYVEVDMSQQKHSSKQRPVVSSSVGAYVPSHTGFGFLPHIPSPSSRLPPTTPTSPSASYTWPRKGAQQEQARKAPVQVADHSSRDPKADDYVRMDLGKAPRLTSPLEGPPPSTTASVTATTTSLITSPRPSLAPLVSLSSLPPAYKFALTSSSVGAKRATSSAAKSTTTTSTTSNSLVVSSSTSTPTVSISSTASLSSEAKVEALVSTLAPLSSAATASGNLPPSIVSAPTPPPVDMAVAVCVTTSCSTPCVTSSLASSPPPRVSAVECAPACPPSPPPSPLAVSGPIAIPTRASAAPQHALLPSAPPSSLFSATAPSPALCRVVTSCAERPKPDEDPQHQEHQPGAVEKKSSPAKVVTAKAPAAPAQHISSLARRVSSGKDPRSAGGNAKDGSPAAVADSSAKEGAKESAKEVVPPLKAQDGAEGIQDPVARQPPSRRGSRGCARRHSGDKESCETRSARPRRRSSDVSKSAAAQQQEVARAGGRGAMADAEDSSGSYEKLLLAPGSRGHQRKWGAHKSLGERAPSLGWGPLRRQMSSPSAVPDPDGAYEKLLPSNGGPVSRRRSGDKPGGLLPVDATAATSSGGYPPYSPVFSASSSSASSSSSLASVASTILLAPSAIKAANSTTASPTPPPTANATPGEIHYASLDLAPPTGAPTTASSINNNNNSQNDNDNERGGRRSPRVLGRPSSGAESPSGAGGEQPLNYAEIDFSKSMATSAAAKNQRVRH